MNEQRAIANFERTVESGNESNHVALSYRFDSIYSYTLFVDVICTYTRDNNEKPKLRTGKPQGDEKQTLPPQKKPILYSIKCIPYLFFFFPSVEDIFLHHNALLFLRLTSCWRWGVGPLPRTNNKSWPARWSWLLLYLRLLLLLRWRLKSLRLPLKLLLLKCYS